MSHLLPPDGTARAFTVPEALARGMTRDELRGSGLVAPLLGVRIVGREPQVTRAQFLDAVRSIASAEQFLSHTTAARVHGMPMPGRLSHDDVHLAAPTMGSRMRRAGVVGHRLKAEVVEVDGIRVEHPLDTFVHLATVLTLHELVAVADWLLQERNAAHSSKAAMLERLDHFKGARGLPLLRRAIAMARPGVESPRETQLRLLVTGAGHPEPRCNVDVFDDKGTFVARVDLAWPALRIALEYDGEQHRLDDRQYARDIDRLAALASLGWTVIRVTKDHLRDPARLVLPRVAAALGAGRPA